MVLFILTTGAMLQHPRQRTFFSVNMPSGVVSSRDTVSLFYMTGCSQADADYMFPLRLKTEGIVECCQGKKLAQWYIKVCAYLLQGFPGQIAAGLLNILQQCNERFLPLLIRAQEFTNS
jgi:hypothetical protein